MFFVHRFNGTEINEWPLLKPRISEIRDSQGVYVPGGVPLAVVIGKEGFIANAADAADPPTAPAVGAFSIRKLRISSKAFIISSIKVVSNI